MSVFKKVRYGVILGALLSVVLGSHAASALPFVPPGFSAAVISARINSGYQAITNATTFVKTTTSTGYGRYGVANQGNEFAAFIPPSGGVIVSAFAAGVISGLPTDPAGSSIKHLVIFGDFSPENIGLDFTTLFPHSSESALINDLLSSPDVPLPDADYRAFISDAAALGLYGGDGAIFDVVAFSTGTVLGNATVTLVKPAAVPEPLTAALFGAGCIGTATIRRRKKQA